jgi:hypothetical protein
MHPLSATRDPKYKREIVAAAIQTVLRLMDEKGDLIKHDQKENTFEFMGGEMNPEVAENILYGHMPPWVQVNFVGATMTYQITEFGRHVGRIGVEPMYLEQSMGDTCCFVYAAANLIIHEGKECPIITEGVKGLARCYDGATIDQKSVLGFFGQELDMEATPHVGRVFERGGILTILHPIWNLHSVAVVPVADHMERRVWAINSFLGPHVMLIPPQLLEVYCREDELGRPIDTHWVRK